MPYTHDTYVQHDRDFIPVYEGGTVITNNRCKNVHALLSTVMWQRYVIVLKVRVKTRITWKSNKLWLASELPTLACYTNKQNSVFCSMFYFIFIFKIISICVNSNVSETDTILSWMRGSIIRLRGSCMSTVKLFSHRRFSQRVIRTPQIQLDVIGPIVIEGDPYQNF